MQSNNEDAEGNKIFLETFQTPFHTFAEAVQTTSTRCATDPTTH